MQWGSCFVGKKLNLLRRRNPYYEIDTDIFRRCDCWFGYGVYPCFGTSIMAVYSWCTQCQGREKTCKTLSDHKGKGFLQYRVDILLGGRHGTRIRKVYALKKDAETYEHITVTDFKRGLLVPEVGSRSKIPFQDFLKMYQDDYVNLNMKGNSVENYRIGKYRELWGKRALNSLKLEDVENYLLNKLKGKEPVTKTTINREITVLKTMFKWAVTKGYLVKSPVDGLKKYKTDTVRVRWLNDNEIKTLLTGCLELDDPALHDLCLVGLNTGFRKGNLKRLTAHDILGNRIQALETKSGEPYDVPINMTLATVLRKLVGKTGSLLDWTNLRHRWDKLMVHCKFSDVTIHTLRHTFAAQCLKKGIPIDRVSKWLNHHSMEFTRKHYGHLCPTQEAIEINLLNLGSTVLSIHRVGEGAEMDRPSPSLLGLG